MRIRVLRPVLLSLVVVSCSRTGRQTVFIDPALATLVPPETSLLVGARLDKLRQTETYRKHFAGVRPAAVDRFAKETGLDPDKDLWEVLFASDGSESVLMARGRFSPLDMEPKLQREGAERSAYRGYSLFGDDHTSTFFMNQTTALSGSTQLIKRVIDRQNTGGGEHGIPESLRPLVSAIPPESQFWAAFTGSDARLPVPDSSNLGNVNSILRSVASGNLAADLRGGLNLRAAATARTEGDARHIGDSLKAILAIGRSASSRKPDLIRALDTIQVTQTAREVTVSANVPQDLVDRIVDVFGK